MSSKSARLRRRQTARKRREKEPATRPPGAPTSILVPLRPRPALDAYTVSTPRAWAALTGVGASALVLLPAGHVLAQHSAWPHYSATAADTSTVGRPDDPHRDGLEWLQYQTEPQAGTARTGIMTGPVDPWADDVAHHRYGRWGPGSVRRLIGPRRRELMPSMTR